MRKVLLLLVMFSVFKRTIKVYVGTLNLVALFSLFILFSLLLMPLLSTYVDVGAGFIRFSSILYDMNALQALVFLLVSLASILLLSFFIASLVSVVKLKETLDSVAFSRVISTFGKYVLRVFYFLIIMGVISVLIGLIFNLLNIPDFVTQLALLVFWASFIFTPQILVIEDFNLINSMKDAFNFIKKQPLALVYYFTLGVVLVFLLLLLEVWLGQYFAWQHKIISIIILSLVVLPFLQMYATELYVRRYAVARL